MRKKKRAEDKAERRRVEDEADAKAKQGESGENGGAVDGNLPGRD